MSRSPLVVALLTLAIGSCGGDGGGKEGEVLWSTPAVPSPVSLEVDGELVESTILESHLRYEWSMWYVREGKSTDEQPVNDLFREFMGEDGAPVQPLVGDLLLLREAQRRWPEVPEEEVDSFLHRMEQQYGDVAKALVNRYGAEWVRGHAQRRILIDRMLEQIGAEVVPPTEQDVIARWQEMLSQLEVPEEVGDEAAEYLPTYDEMRHNIESALMRERRDAAAFSWIDEQRKGVEAKFGMPDGSTLVLSSP